MVPLTLYGFPLVALVLFAAMRPRQAVIATFVLGWLFLPMASLYIGDGIPRYTKVTAVMFGALAGIALFDGSRMLAFRPSWVDLPIAIWCAVPMLSSVTNGLGVNDGILEIWWHVIFWGVPYFIGRLYFNDAEGLRDLAVGIFVGGLIYAPFCLFEVRMSPQLHNWVYGFHQHLWKQHLRGDGYRPKVFMQHGIAVGLWMGMATLIGAWLWRSGSLQRLWGVPVYWLLAGMFVTTVLCRSFGALVLMIVGLGVLFVLERWRLKAAVLCLAIAPMAYIGTRVTDLWDGAALIQVAERIGGEDRGGSLRYRIEAENILARHALNRPAFGWGGWGRNRPADMGDEDPEVATDGMWVLVLGQRGIVGLVALVGVIMLPVGLACARLRGRQWTDAAMGPAGALAVVLIFFMIDSLFNAMLNPIFVLASGGLVGYFSARTAVQPRPLVAEAAAMPAARQWAEGMMRR